MNAAVGRDFGAPAPAGRLSSYLPRLLKCSTTVKSRTVVPSFTHTFAVVKS